MTDTKKGLTFYPFLHTLSIVTKDRGVIPFKPNHAQRILVDTLTDQHNAGLPMRAIVLKARQIGFSTVTEALQFALSKLYHHTNGLIVAHEDESNKALLGITSTYWETWPFNDPRLYNTKYQGKKTLHWHETGSSINVITAGGRGGGRSRTIHTLHASEVAFWPNADLVMLGLRQTIPNRQGTMIVMESTANGVGGLFYQTWNDAVSGDNEYAPIFAPWWTHPEYLLPGVSIVKPDGEEKALVALMRAGYRLGPRSRPIPPVPDSEVEARLAWRRWAIRNLTGNDILKFQQEYPATPEEAFISTGANVFPLEKLNACYQRKVPERGYLFDDPTNNRIRFIKDERGPLHVFAYPSKDLDWGIYIIGGDATHAVTDPACAQVISRRADANGRLRQLAVFEKRVDPAHFADDLALLGRWYNDALLVPESTGPGYSTIGALLAKNYPHLYRGKFADKTPGMMTEQYGFATNVQRKHWAIGTLLQYIVDEALVIHDYGTYLQLRDYVTKEDGGYGNDDPNGHDDRVMALAIPLHAHQTEPALLPYGATPPPITEYVEAVNAGVQFVRELMFAEPTNYDTYTDEWDN